MEQKNNDRIEKMREEKENKLEMILMEIKSNKSASTVTHPRSEINKNRDPQPSGSKTNMSIGVHASNNENSDSEHDDYPLRASKMKDLRHPARQVFDNGSDVDVTINPDEESDAEEIEDYHNSLFLNLKFLLKNNSARKITRCSASVLFSKTLTILSSNNSNYPIPARNSNRNADKNLYQSFFLVFQFLLRALALTKKLKNPNFHAIKIPDSNPKKFKKKFY